MNIRTPGDDTGFAGLVALLATIMATQALAVDAMLPALPAIGSVLGVADPNRVQAVVTAYIVGGGLGQLIWGPLSDRYGRRPVLIGGLLGYALAAFLCVYATSFTTLLLWRLLHGVAAASAVIGRSVVRDLYSGRRMARVMSLTFIVFLIVPVLAPTVGQVVLLVGTWHTIFVVTSLFGATVAAWAWWRLPETLHPEYRLTITWPHLRAALALVLGNRESLGYTLGIAILFGGLLAYVSSVQQIFATVFHRPQLMPAVFALCAGGMAVFSFFNSRLVERLGTRRISHSALLVFLAVTALHALVAATGAETMWTFTMLQAMSMACFALVGTNFGAMAMDPLGEIAGIGASLQGFITTVGGGLAGGLIGQRFDGSTRPLVDGALVCGILCLLCALYAEGGRLFRPHHQPPHDQSAPHSQAPLH